MTDHSRPSAERPAPENGPTAETTTPAPGATSNPSRRTGKRTLERSESQRKQRNGQVASTVVPPEPAAAPAQRPTRWPDPAPTQSAPDSCTTAADETPLLADESGESPRPPPTGRLTGRETGRLAALAALLVALSTVAGLLAALVLPSTYAARAEIVYPIRQDEPTGFLRQDRTLSTQLVLLNSRAVLAPVAVQEERSVADLQDDVSATVLDDSEVIQLEVRGSSSAGARRTAQAVVEEYIRVEAVGADSDRTFLREELANLGRILTDARARRAQLLSRALPIVGSVAALDLVVADVDREIAEMSSRQQELQEQLRELQSVGGPSVVTSPYEVDGAVSPKPLITGAAGALAGLLVASVTVALLARRWTRIG